MPAARLPVRPLHGTGPAGRLRFRADVPARHHRQSNLSQALGDPVGDGCRAPRLPRYAPWRWLHVMRQSRATVAVSAVSALWSASAWAHTGRPPVLPAPLPNPSTAGFDVGYGVWIVAALPAIALLVAAA